MGGMPGRGVVGGMPEIGCPGELGGDFKGGANAIAGGDGDSAFPRNNSTSCSQVTEFFKQKF